MNRFSRRTALALAAGVVVTASGKAAARGGRLETTTPTTEPDDAESTGATDTTGGDETETTGDTVPDISEYDLEATVRYMYSVGPSRFDPHRATSSFDNASLFLVYDRLVHQDWDANPVPGLATEWEFVDDGGALEFTLREGVTFHDGAAFDAEAVKANLENAKTAEGSAVTSELAAVESIEVLDPLTVRLNLNAPAAQLPLALSDRAGCMVSPAMLGNPDLDNNPVGAGMFKVTDYRPNDRITMERHADYWDDEAGRCAGFEFLISGDPMTRLNAIRTDQCDATFVDPQQEADGEAAGLGVLRTTSLSYYHLQLNRSFEPFASLEVRQALNHAINRPGVVEGLVLGLGNGSCQSFPEGYLAFDEETGTDTYPYDTDRARELLEQAGYADGFEFEMIVPTIPNITQLGEAVQAMLADVGVTANIRQVEPAQTADIFYSRKEGNGLVSPWGGRADPSQTLFLLFAEAGFSNPGSHTTPAVAEAIAKTFEVQPEEERIAALKAASAAVVADALDVVIYYPITPSLYKPNVLGMHGWMSGKPEFRAIGLSAG